MTEHIEVTEIELICIIVNFGHGSKVLHIAKHCGISGGTVFLGKGTVNNRLLEFLALSDVRKEIVLVVSDRTSGDHLLDELNKEFKFEKPNHGIAFTTSITHVVGARCFAARQQRAEKGGEHCMYQSITVVVDKGKAEYAIEAATQAGSRGGTIINARGSGIHETSKVFSMDIEPEKEIVMILSEATKTQAIVDAIRAKLKIDEPGNGMIYIQDVNQTYGLYK